MALSDCVKCWETPCTCGHEYRSWPLPRLREFIETLQKVEQERLGELIKDQTLPRSPDFWDGIS